MVAVQKTIYYSLLSSVVLAGDAPFNTDSSKKAVARAHLDNGLVKGMIEFTSNKEGVVNVHLDVTGLPPNAGPFQYQIHENKVSSKGYCQDAGDLFNPYHASDVPCDDLDSDSLCAVGDLSGKHGFINTTCFETEYVDPYLSLNKRNGAFVGGKSIVITDQHDNIISCGSIKTKRSRKFARDLNSAEIEEEEEGLADEPIPSPLLKNTTTNSTMYGDSSDDKYDSGSNMLIASGVVAALAGGFAALL